jgi:hypothetical protein
VTATVEISSSEKVSENVEAGQRWTATVNVAPGDAGSPLKLPACNGAYPPEHDTIFSWRPRHVCPDMVCCGTRRTA